MKRQTPAIGRRETPLLPLRPINSPWKNNAIADKYKHLEEVMLQMAELSVQTDPRRAALLKKALAQSKEQLIGVRIERLIEFLGNDQLSRAIENQTELDQELRSLLELLLSENRAKRIQSEKARLREYLKRLSNILKQEKDVQARTVDRGDHNRLAGEQGKIAEKTGGLAKDIKTNEEGGEQNTETRPEGNQPKAEGEKKAENGEKKAESGKGKTEGENKAEGQQGQSHDEQEAQNLKAKISKEILPANVSKRRKNACKTPNRNWKKPATKTPQKIRKKPSKSWNKPKPNSSRSCANYARKKSSGSWPCSKHDSAKCWKCNSEVYEGTLRLDKIPPAERTHNHEIESSRLSGKQLQIVVEADKALLLLREDGTTVAFAEAADQMRIDMQQVVDRLAQAKVGQVTQGIELDIIATLEEMIDALKKAQKDSEKNRQKANLPGQQSQQGESSLVDKLAELKMIRALQMRINTRTQRYSKLIEGEQAENAELVDALKRLAERQERVYRVTHDLSSGKTE